MDDQKQEPKEQRDRDRDKEESRQKLVNSALKFFALNGFEGTTIRDVADDAGVNLSLVSYYFNGKDGLYRECLTEFARSRSEFAQTVFAKAPESAEEFRIRLQLLIEEMINFQIENPYPCRMILREIDQGLPHAKDIFESTLLKSFGLIVRFIAEAKERKIVAEDVDPLIVTAYLQGAVFHLLRTEPIRKQFFNQTIKDPEIKKKHIDQLLGMFLKGILK